VAEHQPGPDSSIRLLHVYISALEWARGGEDGYNEKGNKNGHVVRVLDQAASEPDSAGDNLGDLLEVKNADTMVNLYGTSMPKASFFESLGSRGTRYILPGMCVHGDDRELVLTSYRER
jgi:hypothetical protein